MDIETIATSRLKEVISTTDVLSPHINEKDKELSWDGNVYIYSNKKKNGIKKVPVQVKGTIKADHSKEKIVFPMDLADIENYLLDGGVMLFVVYISSDGKKKTIYYESLLPVKIKILKKRNEGKKRIPVECKSFPEDSEKMVSIFLNFYEHMQRQRSYATADLKPIEELEKQGILEGVSVPIVTYGKLKNDVKNILFQDDLYMYARIKGSAIPQPLELIPLGLHLSEKVDCDVSVGKNIFYSFIWKTQSENCTKFSIGKSFSLSLDMKNQQMVISINPDNHLKDIIVDTEFILAIAEMGYFQVGDTIIPIDVTKLFDENRIRKLKDRLEYCLKIKSVLDFLKIDVDIDLSTTTDEDYRNTNRLYSGLVKGKKVSGFAPNIPAVAKMNYLGMQILIGFKEAGQGLYNIYDYNSAPTAFAYEEDGIFFPTSRYDIFKPDNFLEIANIDLRKLIESYIELSDNNYIFVRANQMLLNLLTAYDKSNDSKPDILACAYDMAVWLVNAEIELSVLPISLRKLNLWQVMKRQNDLPAEVLKEVFQMAEDPEQPEEIKVGAYLILGDQIAVDNYFEKLSPESQAAFKNYPIYRFYIPTIET